MIKVQLSFYHDHFYDKGLDFLVNFHDELLAFKALMANFHDKD